MYPSLEQEQEDGYATQDGYAQQQSDMYGSDAYESGLANPTRPGSGFTTPLAPSSTVHAAAPPPAEQSVEGLSSEKQQQQRVEGGSKRRGSFLSSAFTILEKVIHGDEDGTADENEPHDDSATTSQSSGDGGQGGGLDSGENSGGSWFQGVFMSKKDKKNVAKMGKSLDAFYDKSLGKWVFPNGGGDQGGDQGGGQDPLMSGGGCMSGPTSKSQPNQPNHIGRPSTGPPSMGPPSMGPPSMGPPSMSGGAVGGGRRPRYASFGLNVAQPTNDAAGNVPLSNLPPGDVNMIPGAF